MDMILKAGMEGINKWFYFSCNYPVALWKWRDFYGDEHEEVIPTFIPQAEWTCGAEHMAVKWLATDNADPMGRLNSFYAELSVANRRVLLEWVLENYSSEMGLGLPDGRVRHSERTLLEEAKALYERVVAMGGRYEWNETVDGVWHDGAPWVTMYVGDGVWHDMEVYSVEAADGYVKMKAADFAAGDCELELAIDSKWDVFTLGDLTEVVNHLPKE